MYTRYSHYGWRARIGLIVPSVNITIEPELASSLPEGVSVHVSRVPLRGRASADSYMAMGEAASRAAEELADADVDVIGYACTSGSIFEGEEMVTRLEAAAGGIPVVTTAQAVVDALHALKISKVAVATPYVEFVNDEEKRFLEQLGFDVRRILGLDLGHDETERKMIGRQSPGVAYRIAREADTVDAEGIFISCTNFPTFPIVARLESETGKPVVTSNQATLWAVLRKAGIRDSIPSLGRLMDESANGSEAH